VPRPLVLKQAGFSWISNSLKRSTSEAIPPVYSQCWMAVKNEEIARQFNSRHSCGGIRIARNPLF